MAVVVVDAAALAAGEVAAAGAGAAGAVVGLATELTRISTGASLGLLWLAAAARSLADNSTVPWVVVVLAAFG